MKCRDCDNDADPKFEMNFDDIGEAPLHWCAECGPRAQKMSRALDEAFKTRPGFAEELETAIGELPKGQGF